MRIRKGVLYFGVRMAIFLAMLGVVLPFVFQFVSSIIGTDFTARYSNMRSLLFLLIVVAAFIIFERKNLLKIEHLSQNAKETTLFGSLAAMFFFANFILSYIYGPDKMGSLGFHFVLLYGSYLIGAVLLFFAIFNLWLINKFYKHLIALVSISGIFFAFTLFLRELWTIFSGGVARASALLLKIFYNDVSLSFDLSGYPSLAVGDFGVGIGAPCSGIDSISMFMSLFFLMMLLDWNVLDKKRAGILFFFGALGMYAVSILRVFGIMVIGTFDPELALGMFHDNAGWIMFVVYILVVLHFGYKWMKKEDRK